MPLLFARLLALISVIFAGIAIYLFIVSKKGSIASIYEKRTKGYVDWMVKMLDRMFITISKETASMIIIGSVILFGLLGWVITIPFPDILVFKIIRVIVIVLITWGPGKIPGGWSMPRKVINHMWKRRLDKLDVQMIDGLTLMSNALKSGLSLPQAMEMVRDELGNPISQEFGLVLDHQRLGATIEESLRSMEERLQTEDIRIIVTSIIILRESGGNLSETLDTIAYTIRERQKVLDRIKTLTAQGVYQGIIITCMPFVLGLILYFMDPELISRMWKTPIGWILIFVMLFLQIVGAILIRKIVMIKV